jgi:Flp pilus assembly pilin Flp
MLVAYMQGCTNLADRLKRQDGQALVEYALLISLVVIGAFVILGILGGQVSELYSTVASDL